MTRAEPRWLGRLVIDEAHFRQLREHGGAHGLRDEDALESALARPQQRWQYDERATLSNLAAALAFGLARNRSYVDGNKRVALVALVAFLDRNGVDLTADNAEALEALLGVAGGAWSEADLGRWVDEHSRARV